MPTDPAIKDAALELLENNEASVRIAAAQSILLSLPITRAFELLPQRDTAVMTEFCEWATWKPDPLHAIPLLTRLTASENSTIAANALASLESIGTNYAG